MLTDVLLILAGALLFCGALRYGLARSGPQETLGGLMVTFGIVAVALAGIVWKLGL